MIKKYISLLLLLAFLFPLVSPAGAGSLYTPNNPLEMSYGETKTIEIQLSNRGVDESITFEIGVIEGSDIISLEKTTYTVGADSELFIPLTVSIPENYAKQVQRVHIEATPGISDQQGMVTLGTAYTVSFDVILSAASEEASESSLPTILLILVVVIILVVIIILVIMKRRE